MNCFENSISKDKMPFSVLGEKMNAKTAEKIVTAASHSANDKAKMAVSCVYCELRSTWIPISDYLSWNNNIGACSKRFYFQEVLSRRFEGLAPDKLGRAIAHVSFSEN